jgi:hypothetical protein
MVRSLPWHGEPKLGILSSGLRLSFSGYASEWTSQSKCSEAFLFSSLPFLKHLAISHKLFFLDYLAFAVYNAAYLTIKPIADFALPDADARS